MPLKEIDALTAVAPWQARSPDGETPSTELSLTVNASTPRPSGPAICARIGASAKALNHSLRRPLNALDLSELDEIRLWINSERTADGSLARPFYLAMRLGSAAVPLDAPANSWQRLLPVAQSRIWRPARLSIDDLPATIRGAVNMIELRCVADGVAFVCNLSGIFAARDAIVTDVDLALLARLDGTLSLGGNTVPALLHTGGGVIAHTRPYFEITHYDILYSPARTEAARPRGDFSDHGFSIEPSSNAYELFYQVTAVADDRPTQSAMLDFALRALTPRGEIMVNNYLLPMESVCVDPVDQIGGFRSDRVPLFYKISARLDAGTRERVVPVKTVTINTELAAAQ